jgi:hypothetical protein
VEPVVLLYLYHLLYPGVLRAKKQAKDVFIFRVPRSVESGIILIDQRYAKISWLIRKFAAILLKRQW